MSSMPTNELLEQMHAFPCVYVFKVIGKADAGFEARRGRCGAGGIAGQIDPPFQVREAVGGRHLAVTLEPMVQSAHQVLAIYRRLGALDGVVMLF